MANFFYVIAKRVCILLLGFFEEFKLTRLACGNQIPSNLIFLTVSERSNKVIKLLNFAFCFSLQKVQFLPKKGGTGQRNRGRKRLRLKRKLYFLK